MNCDYLYEESRAVPALPLCAALFICVASGGGFLVLGIMGRFFSGGPSSEDYIPNTLFGIVVVVALAMGIGGPVLLFRPLYRVRVTRDSVVIINGLFKRISFPVSRVRVWEVCDESVNGRTAWQDIREYPQRLPSRGSTKPEPGVLLEFTDGRKLFFHSEHPEDLASAIDSGRGSGIAESA